MGLNGAGKTTLLRCLAGLVAADCGELLYDGRPFSRGDLPLRRRLFFLPDFPLLFWDRSIIHNLSVIARLYGREDAEALGRAVGLLRELDLLPIALAPAGTLSRGQMHKTALAALMLVDPELWLLDEPLSSGMDPLALIFFKRAARAAFSPCLCAFALSGVSDDSQIRLRRGGCLAALLIVAGALTLLALGAAALFAPGAWGWGLLACFAALAWGVAGLYVRLYERGAFDLVSTARE